MGASDEESRARQLLADILAFIASSESHWFTINGDATHDFSLCRRLGFNHENDFFAFLVTCGLAGYEDDRNGNR